MTTTLKPGHERQWVRCNTCNDESYFDFIPYSLGNPVMTLPCGHGAAQRPPDAYTYIDPPCDKQDTIMDNTQDTSSSNQIDSPEHEAIDMQQDVNPQIGNTVYWVEQSEIKFDRIVASMLCQANMNYNSTGSTTHQRKMPSTLAEAMTFVATHSPGKMFLHFHEMINKYDLNPHEPHTFILTTAGYCIPIKAVSNTPEHAIELYTKRIHDRLINKIPEYLPTP